MGSGYSGNYTGTDGGSQPYQPLYSVEPSMHQLDINDGTYHDGHYDKNPTAQKLEDLINGNYIGSKRTSMEVPYVIDRHGNIIIGRRNGNGSKGTRTPHPTLIGGKDPKVQMAGILSIHGGKIAGYDDRSGHYKPNKLSYKAADEAFGKLPSKLFK